MREWHFSDRRLGAQQTRREEMYPYPRHYSYFPAHAAQPQQPAQPHAQPLQPTAGHVAQLPYAYPQPQQQPQQMSYAAWQAQPLQPRQPHHATYAAHAPVAYPNYQTYALPMPSAVAPPPQPSVVPRTTVPPPTYICHRCRQRGHWITDCPTQRPAHSTQQQQQQQHAAKPPPPPSAPPATAAAAAATATVTVTATATAISSTPTAAAPSTPSQPATTFFCEPCEKEFSSASQYQAHRSSHERCRAPDCNFEGSKKVVIAHYHATHGKFKGSGYKLIDVEGQKFRVLLGTSPDEVKEWREQRRKRFPTKENVSQKEAGRQALAEAGGIVPPAKGRKRKLPASESVDQQAGPVSASPAMVTAADETEAAPKRLAVEGSATTSTSALAALSSYADASDGEEGEVREEMIIPATSQDAADSEKQQHEAHVGDEGEAGQEEGEAADASSPTKGNKTDQRKRRPCTFFLKGRCQKGEECPFSHDVERKVCKYFAQGRCRKGRRCPFAHERAATTAGAEATATATPAAPDGDQKRVKKSMGLNLPLPMRNSKLYKSLVQDEIVEEENIVLQCLHYIVRRNFMKQPLQAAEMAVLVELAQAERAKAQEAAEARAAKQSLLHPLLASDHLDPALLAQVDPELAQELAQGDEDDDAIVGGVSSPNKAAKRGAFGSGSELEDGEVSDSGSEESESGGDEEDEEDGGSDVESGEVSS